MKTTHQWLEDYTPTGLSAQEVADALTYSGTEVEHMSDLAGGDTLFQIEVTSNRVDCLGMLGLAREISAVTGTPVSFPQSDYPISDQSHSVTVEIQPDALEACPYYTAQIIRGVKVGPSPEWLRKRLESVGCASINNVVDVTNYVLFEYSQPLHAFDLNLLKGQKIIVRMAHEGEEFEAINHRQYKLDARDLIIADAERGVAIAGIMGGVNSEVVSETVDVLLESAYFNPRIVKAGGRKLDRQHSENLASESRYRFERGVDHGAIMAASRRAAQLILETAGGTVIGEPIVAGQPGQAWLGEVTLRAGAARRTLGVEVPLDRCAEILTALGLETVESGSETIRLRVPSFRRDLEREIDLVEEIGRVRGLGEIESRLTLPIARSRMEPHQEARHQCHGLLQGLGFDEALTDTFVPSGGAYSHTPWSSGPALEARGAVNVNYPALRRSLMPSLLRIYAGNERHAEESVQMYEIAAVALTGDREMPDEKFVLAMIGPDYATVRGGFDGLLERLHVSSMEVRPSEFPLFADDRGAELFHKNQRVGVVGEVSEAVIREFDLNDGCAVLEVDLDTLLGLRDQAVSFKPLPRYPEMLRDLAVVVDEAVKWADIKSLAEEKGSDNLREVSFFDEFRGKQVPRGKKSIAFRLRFRNDDRTLVSEETDASVAMVVEALKSNFAAELRS